MAKYSTNELVQFVLDSKDIDNDAKSQLIKVLREEKKFGIVWEQHPEEADYVLKSKLPVLNEKPELAFVSDDKTAPNHVLIEGDNIYALHDLCYSFEGCIDLIYIDPPYNSGARDWRYNNDYVDALDQYRHSKWLSMMYNRLIVARRLLKVDNATLIVTIDEKEYHHLGCLLEELFPSARIQMVSTVINVKGVAREKEFSRVNEYIYIVQIGDSRVEALPLGAEWLGNIKSSGRDKVRLGSLLRSGSNSERRHSPGCFYPIYFTEEGKFVKAGDPIPFDVDRNGIPVPDGLVAVWPIHANGSEGVWQYSKQGFEKLVSDGFVYFGNLKNGRIGISYAPKGVQQKIKDGLFKISGYDENGTAIIDDSEYSSTFIPGNQWSIPSHNATEYGSKLLKDMFGDKVFSYPKSLFAVEDTIRFFVANKPDALILDFFAGSGTTMHATMRLNAEDGGHRRCILVTNNENNICEEVTYPRNKKVIEGYATTTNKNVEGLKNNNLRYFKVDFVDRPNTHQGKRLLSRSLTDLLRIKENCYQEQPSFGKLNLQGKEGLVRFFADGEHKMLIIYEPRVLSHIVNEIKAMDLGKDELKVYIFADGAYPYTEDFRDVLEKISLVALPYAFNQALKHVLPSADDINIDNAELCEEEKKQLMREAIESENNEQ